MSLPGASPSLADRLVTACDEGDLPSAKAAVADGASVNEEGRTPGWRRPVLPLAASVARKHHDVVVWLLSHGADPNGVDVMFYGARNSTTAILQLLIDAGGDVNRKSSGDPPLFAATSWTRCGCCWLSPPLILPSSATVNHQNSVHVTRAGLQWRT